MTVSRMPSSPRVSRPTTRFTEFSPYENGRVRRLRFDVNALADFEQETGMGFAQLMKQRAVFASARAMIWAGLKHEDRALSIEGVGMFLSDYLTDESVEPGTHSIDSILMVAIEAAIEQGALGRRVKEPDPEHLDDDRALPNGDVLDAQAQVQHDQAGQPIPTEVVAAATDDRTS